MVSYSSCLSLDCNVDGINVESNSLIAKVSCSSFVFDYIVLLYYLIYILIKKIGVVGISKF